MADGSRKRIYSSPLSLHFHSDESLTHWGFHLLYRVFSPEGSKSTLLLLPHRCRAETNLEHAVSFPLCCSLPPPVPLRRWTLRASQEGLRRQEGLRGRTGRGQMLQVYFSATRQPVKTQSPMQTQKCTEPFVALKSFPHLCVKHPASCRPGEVDCGKGQCRPPGSGPCLSQSSCGDSSEEGACGEWAPSAKTRLSTSVDVI